MVFAEASATAVPTRALICPLASLVVTSRTACEALGVPMLARWVEKFVNGPREIFADTGDGPRLLDLTLGAEEDVRSLAVRLAALGGRRLDDSSPYVDVRLPDGVRMNAIVPPSFDNLIQSFIMIVGTLVLIFVLSWQLSLIVFACMLIMYFYYLL